MMEAHPQLSGREALRLLLGSSRDGGDPVYGWGVLDLGKVFAG